MIDSQSFWVYGYFEENKLTDLEYEDFELIHAISGFDDEMNQAVGDVIIAAWKDFLAKEVYTMLKDRKIHPAGKSDGKRWYATNNDLLDVRNPSAAWPWSQMVACRTLKYVKNVMAKFECKNKDDLIKCV